MKVEELIAELSKYPQEENVCIFDWRKNLHHASEETCPEGVYSDIKTERVALDKEEIEYAKDVYGTEHKPWIAITFENDDYSDDGELLIED